MNRINGILVFSNYITDWYFSQNFQTFFLLWLNWMTEIVILNVFRSNHSLCFKWKLFWKIWLNSRKKTLQWLMETTKQSMLLYYISVSSAERWHISTHWVEFNPFQPGVAFHIETSHLFCSANDWFLYKTQNAEMS